MELNESLFINWRGSKRLFKEGVTTFSTSVFAFWSFWFALVWLWFLGKRVGTICKLGENNFSQVCRSLILEMGMTGWEIVHWTGMCELEAWVHCASTAKWYLDIGFSEWQKKWSVGFISQHGLDLLPIFLSPLVLDLKKEIPKEWLDQTCAISDRCQHCTKTQSLSSQPAFPKWPILPHSSLLNSIFGKPILVTRGKYVRRSQSVQLKNLRDHLLRKLLLHNGWQER